MKNFVRLKISENASEYGVYCPVCGKGIFAEGGCEGCRHVVFNHIRNAEDDVFNYLAPGYFRIAKRAEKEGRDPLQAVAEALAQSPAALMFEIKFVTSAGKPSRQGTLTTGVNFAP